MQHQLPSNTASTWLKKKTVASRSHRVVPRRLSCFVWSGRLRPNTTGISGAVPLMELLRRPVHEQNAGRRTEKIHTHTGSLGPGCINLRWRTSKNHAEDATARLLPLSSETAGSGLVPPLRQSGKNHSNKASPILSTLNLAE